MSDAKPLKANEDLLNRIHRKVADRILANLDNPDAEGDAINQAIRFLKDNNIKADPEFNPTVAQISEKTGKVDVKKLPFAKPSEE